MKTKIANGEWTPCITNSYSKSRCYVNGVALRSSWEALFFMINPSLMYEKTRIPYSYNGVSHTYIIDFEDEIGKILYEIKPKSEMSDEVVKVKEKFAKQWCETHGYEYVFIDDDWFYENIWKIEEKYYNMKESIDGDTRRKIERTINSFSRRI